MLLVVLYRRLAHHTGPCRVCRHSLLYFIEWSPAAQMNLSATSVSLLPANYCRKLVDPNWHAAMADEFKALLDNGTWHLVPRPHGANIVSKWIFEHKFNSDGSLAHHKARWVVDGFFLQHGVNYEERFSPVIKPATIRTVLSITASRVWPIY